MTPDVGTAQTNTLNGVTSSWTGLDVNNKPNWTVTQQGAPFQFTEHYVAPGLQTHTIIQREQTIQSVTTSTSIFSAIAVAALVTCSPVMATDVGGVSATANPVANSSGSVTNQAIQVLQGPYITNTYGGGVQCQGPTANFTPYVTRTGTWSDPYRTMVWNDPVYNNADNNDDGIPDSPGEILYYIPTRTGQKATKT